MRRCPPGCQAPYSPTPPPPRRGRGAPAPLRLGSVLRCPAPSPPLVLGPRRPSRGPAIPLPRFGTRCVCPPHARPPAPSRPHLSLPNTHSHTTANTRRRSALRWCDGCASHRPRRPGPCPHLAPSGALWRGPPHRMPPPPRARAPAGDRPAERPAAAAEERWANQHARKALGGRRVERPPRRGPPCRKPPAAPCRCRVSFESRGSLQGPAGCRAGVRPGAGAALSWTSATAWRRPRRRRWCALPALPTAAAAGSGGRQRRRPPALLALAPASPRIGGCGAAAAAALDWAGPRGRPGWASLSGVPVFLWVPLPRGSMHHAVMSRYVLDNV
jgi:hypothetical protein